MELDLVEDCILNFFVYVVYFYVVGMFERVFI